MPSAADIVIVGGGVVGSSVAYHLREVGCRGRIVVIERDHTYARASSNLAMGGIRQQFTLDANVRMVQWSVGFYRDLEPRASLAGGIVYMFQIAGGSIGLGLNTAIVDSAASLPVGIGQAFRVDAILAVCGLLIAAFFVGGTVDLERLRGLRHHHRAHA